MKLKRAFSWLLACAMMLTMLPTALAESFGDTRGHWAESVIDKWSDYGVIQGYNGNFNPNNPITRGDMAVVIDKLLDYQTEMENTFTDLGDTYYTGAVLRAADAGVLKGDGQKVRPADPITREEAVSVLARALSVKSDGTSTGFADNGSIAAWAMADVSVFEQKGYVKGKPGGLFDPKANVTRAEVIQMLDSMISDYIVKSGTVTPKGNGIVIVKASGVTLDKANLSGTVILGGKAGEVLAKDCEITGNVVKIALSTLKTVTGGASSGGSSGGSSKPAAPGAYPLPKGQETSKSLGVFDYDMTYYVTLTAQDGADIYYEIAEGADAAPTPTTASTKFETYQYKQIMIEQPTSDSSTAAEKNQKREKTYNIKAIAVKNGKTSTVSNWNYTVTSNPRSELKISKALDAQGKEIDNVWLIQDYDSDKMFLINGSERALMLDMGLFDKDAPADLYGAVREIVGDDKPIEAVCGHPHPDHAKMAYQFLKKGDSVKLYVNERGTDTLMSYLISEGVGSGAYADEAAVRAAVEASGGISNLVDGDVIDLGDVQLKAIEMPGHQVAGVMLFDEASGNLFTSDQMGNNRAHLTDSFWMQFGDSADPMDVYLSTLQIVLEKLDGKVKNILTGHNDVTLDGQGSYFANLEAAVQQVVDKGRDALTPTLRTLDTDEYLTKTMTTVYGDRLKDVNWAGINVNTDNFLSEEAYRNDPTTIAELSNLSVHEPGAKGNLLWDDQNFGINVNWKYEVGSAISATRKTNLTFTANVDADVDTIEIVPTAASSGASITVNGKAVASGAAYQTALTGATTKFTVKSTAKDGKTAKVYTVVVNKAGSNQVSAPYTYTDYDNYTDPFYPNTPGIFTVTQYIALFSDTEGATIHYTLDGSDPKTSATAKVFNQTKFKAASGKGGAEVAELITIGADTGDDWDGEARQTRVILKAYAEKAGMDDSAVVTYEYIIDRMSKNSHKSRVLYDEDGMKVWQIIDYDSDKMYLIKGADKALLIDAGMAPARANNLYEYAKTLAGTAEVDLYISHGHPDHTTQIGDFVDAGRKVYMNENDLDMAKGFINDKTVTDDDFTFIEEGFRFDLGGVVLDNYFVPGHTPGSMLLLDKEHGILYSSDAIGCNRRSVADSLTLASNDVRVLLSSVRVFKDKMNALDAAGEIDIEQIDTWTGHDDYVISDLNGHLDTVIEAAQNIVDYGPDKAMRDSVRNTAGSDGASFAGDRYANGSTGHFICMNGKKATALGGQDYMTVSELANVKVTVAGETENRMIGFSSTHAFSSGKVGEANRLVAEVPVGTERVEITPTAMSSNATITVNETSLSNGKASVTLNNGYKDVTITVTAPDGETQQVYTLTVRTSVDSSDPYKTLYPGKHVEEVTLSDGSTRTFTSYVPGGARESTAGIFVLPDKDADVFEIWKTLADNTDTAAIDAEWETQQEKFIVVYLDDLTYDDPEADIDYVNQAYATASGRSMYCIHEAKNYMVGYGEGGTIAQMAAMDQTAVWAGLATIGAGAVDADWIAENGAEMASSLNGFNDQSSSTRKSTTPKHTLPLPVWMIGDEADEATLAYWKSANKIDGEGTTEDGITKYVRTKDWQTNDEEDETIYGMNRDKDAYRVWVSGKPEGNLEETIWTDFLYGVRRWMADPGGDLRMTLDPIRDQGMTRHYEEVGGWMREWYVYAPESIGENAPVVFANHGYTLNGAVYSGQTDWSKVAEQEKFIVIFPSAINGNISDNGNAPWPAWNIALDPSRMDELEFFRYMLEDVAKDYSIDRGRVYATGHSWGSQMTHVLAVNEPEMFAAVAPLSGFVFNSAVFEQLAAAQAEENFTGVPVYMAAGTEGGTEWAICPVPLTESNSSGQTLAAWFTLNGCDSSIDWDKINGNNGEIGSLDWKSDGAFKLDGEGSRWYTLTYEADSVPMVRAEIVDYMPHATMTEHSFRVWNTWFAHYSRTADGELVYTK